MILVLLRILCYAFRFSILCCYYLLAATGFVPNSCTRHLHYGGLGKLSVGCKRQYYSYVLRQLTCILYFK